MYSSVILIAVFLSACSDSAIETERLNELQPIMFSNSTDKTVITDKTASLSVPAECDKTTSEIHVATTESGPFVSIASYDGANLSRLVEDCRKSGSTSFDVLQWKLLVAPTSKATKTLFFKAISGKTESIVTKLNVAFNPKVTAAPRGMDFSPSGNTITSANYRMRVQMGRPFSSNTQSGNYRIKSNNQ